MPRRVGLVTLALAALVAACTSGSPPLVSTGPAPTSDPGPPPPIAPTDGARLSLTSHGVVPKQVRVYQGSRVTFVNDDVINHEIQSDPLHVHTDCPELNAVGYIVPGQSRESLPLNVVRACGFHDHTREGDVAFHGAVFVDPR
jgi:hypothetical protein